MHSWDINHTSSRLLNYSDSFFRIPRETVGWIYPLHIFKYLVVFMVFKLAWVVTLTTWPFLFIAYTFSLTIHCSLSMCMLLSCWKKRSLRGSFCSWYLSFNCMCHLEFLRCYVSTCSYSSKMSTGGISFSISSVVLENPTWVWRQRCRVHTT